jgi:16S rRNA (adenine(1408)-N(1))-methyltransferase
VENPCTNSIDENSKQLLPPTGGGVIVDLGTGDGRFVYQSAQNNPNRFYIGIDASAGALEKISEKIHRKRTKGGLKNVLFVKAAVEDLPSDLDGVADEVHVHFPWGSLLKAVATGDVDILRNVRRICAEDALLEIIIGIDEQKDRSEFQRLELPPLTEKFVETILIDLYQNAGFKILEYGNIEPTNWPRLCTSWAQKLEGGGTRSLLFLIAQAIKLE